MASPSSAEPPDGADLTPAPAPPPAPVPRKWGLRDAVLGLVASFLLSNVIGAAVLAAGGYLDPESPDVPLWLVALLQIPLWVGLIGALVLAVRRSHGTLGSEFGFTSKPRDVPIGLVVGVLTQLVAVPLLYLPILTLFDLDADDVSAPARALTDRAEGIGVLLLALVVVVGAPIVEELFFRGMFLRALDVRYGPGWALVWSSVVFGLFHFQLLQLPALILFGFVAGWLTQRTGRLGPAIWAHAAFNAVTVVVLLAAR